MRILDRIAAPHLARHLPRRSIRLRLTVIYAGLFLASGVGLLAITYVLVRHATGGEVSFSVGLKRTTVVASGGSEQPPRKAKVVIRTKDGEVITGSLTSKQLQAQRRQLRAQASRQHDADMRQLLEQSGIALAVMAAISILLGWLAAGRVLRPIRTINERAREISATSLHKRLALEGPDDELKQLATTFDELLARLEASFSAQRQFVANASHELRSPLTRAQTVAEVALSDPGATVDSLRASHERVLAAGRQQERIIEALLTLARSERGLDQHEPFDLAAITDAVLLGRRSDVERRSLEVHTTLEPAPVSGDPRLAERLVANLVDNAVRHNVAHGRIEIATATQNGHVVLSVANTGRPVPPEELERLFLPFQRLDSDRTGHGDGVGLGLSIVSAIATAHQATVTSRSRADGGLEIDVAFPAIRSSAGR